MAHIKLIDILNENRSKQLMRQSLEEDLQFLQRALIEEGLWDTIKQKVGGALEKTSEKAKELLIQPLINVVMARYAKDSPEQFKQDYEAIRQNPKNALEILKRSSSEQKQIEKQLATVNESLTEQAADDFIQEYIDMVLEEAKILKDDPRNVKRRERYAQRKAARLAAANAGKKQEPPATDNTKKEPEKSGNAPAKGIDKLGIAAIEKTGDFVKGAGDLVKKGMDTKVGQAAKGAIGGLISKVYKWAKSHPKITSGIAFGLLGALFTAASIGSGGIVPLITTSLAAAGGGALKGGLVGGGVGAGKELYSQIKGGAKSFKDVDYKKVGTAALKTGGKGAAIGAAVGAGANVLGKAAAGISNMFSSGVPTNNPNDFLKDLTPAEQRALGIEGKTWAEKYNPNDMKTWKIKPSINSTQGYITAQKENDLLQKVIMSKVKSGNLYK